MEKISISKLRSNGFTAFEAEVINYALVNNLEVGTTFVGVPNISNVATIATDLMLNYSESEIMNVILNDK